MYLVAGCVLYGIGGCHACLPVRQARFMVPLSWHQQMSVAVYPPLADRTLVLQVNMRQAASYTLHAAKCTLPVNSNFARGI